jgi:aerobic-type carbon monoxide dehydrogenase small subunit (CoxS/CutS family)
VKLNVNGADVELNDRSAKSPLLWVLRDVLGLRETKYGCGIGYCAACTVLIDGRNTKSCQTPAERAVGTAVTTVEGASATTGPRLSMTRARSRHPGSPDAHPCGRAAAPAPLQRHGMGRGLR